MIPMKQQDAVKSKPRNATTPLRQAKLQALTSLYFSSPRKDSLSRFIRRILNPKAHRYQSLLRGAMRSASRERHGIKDPS